MVDGDNHLDKQALFLTTIAQKQGSDSSYKEKKHSEQAIRSSSFTPCCHSVALSRDKHGQFSGF